MQPSTLYLAPTGADAAVLAAGIAERAGATVESVQTERRTVLDTFDWRVKRGGFALEHVTSSDGNRLVLRRWGAAAPVVTVPVADGAPSTLDDLPSGRMREQLAPLI